MESSVLYLDVSDLLWYARDHTTLSDIHRAPCEIALNLLGARRPESMPLVALDETQTLGTVETSALRDLIAHMRAGYVPSPRSTGDSAPCSRGCDRCAFGPVMSS